VKALTAKVAEINAGTNARVIAVQIHIIHALSSTLCSSQFLKKFIKAQILFANTFAQFAKLGSITDHISISTVDNWFFNI